jgi:hypothetical protein
VTIVGLAAVLWLLYRERDGLRRAFAITCGTFLVTPYAFNYDMGALCVCAALLAGRAHEPESGALRRLPIALVAVIPAAVMNLGRAGVPITPLILAVGLLALAVAARRVSARPVGTLTPAQ